MKKQAVIIYDYVTDKVVKVIGVRDLTSDQFEKLHKEAKANEKRLFNERAKTEKEKEERAQEEIANLQSQISDLRLVVCYLLGFADFEEETLNQLLRREEDTKEEEPHE